MNTIDPSTAAPATHAPAYKDRTVGLVIFGVLEITMGALTTLMVALMVFAAAIARTLPDQNPAMTTRAMTQSVALYAGISVFFVVVGIGSIRARRWARALMLIISWQWMITGVLASLAIGFIMPGMMRAMAHAPGMPHGRVPLESLSTIITVVMVIFCVLFLVLLPGGFVLFYRSPHVKATCEAKDPVVRWTDRAPLPVIALAVMFGWGAISYSLMAYSTPMFPAFGSFVTGTAGSLLCLGLAAIWGVLAVGVYRMRMTAWWAALALVTVLGLSTMQTFLQGDILDAYRRVGVPEQQVEMLREMGMTSTVMPWVMVAVMLPFIGYVVYVRRYFTAARGD